MVQGGGSHNSWLPWTHYRACAGAHMWACGAIWNAQLGLYHCSGKLAYFPLYLLIRRWSSVLTLTGSFYGFSIGYIFVSFSLWCQQLFVNLPSKRTIICKLTILNMLPAFHWHAKLIRKISMVPLFVNFEFIKPHEETECIMYSRNQFVLQLQNGQHFTKNSHWI
jgi:hypothetical protein